MGKWYQSSATKGVLVVLSHIAAMAVAVCILFVATYPGKEVISAIRMEGEKEYADTEGFVDSVESASYDIAKYISYRTTFEDHLGGTYAPDKVFDVNEYTQEGTVSGQNISGLAYRLGDLVELAQKDYGEKDVYVVVCKLADETYDYFLLDDYKRMSAEATSIYVDSWKFYVYREAEPFLKLQTVEGKTLLELVNEDERWNGHLEKANEALRNVMRSIENDYWNYMEGEADYTEGNTNLSYLFVNYETNAIYSNRTEYVDISHVSEYIEEMKQKGKYVKGTPKLVDFETNMNASAELWCRHRMWNSDDFVYMLAIDTEYPIQDGFYNQNRSYQRYGSFMGEIMTCAILSTAILLICVLWLSVIAGKSSENGKVKLVWFDKVKTEVAAVVVFGIWLSCVFLLGECISYTYYDWGVDGTRLTEMLARFGLVALEAFITCALFLIGYLSLIRRIKAKTLWKDSLLRWIIMNTGRLAKWSGRAVQTFVENRSVVTPVVLALVLFLVIYSIEFIIESPYYSWDALRFLYQIFRVMLVFVIGILLIKRAIAKQKLREGIARIAGGDVNYKIPTTQYLTGVDLEIANNINNIGAGIQKAVEQSMKDERLKTDLLTNVSHDIKTPLTSIINYVDLLKREKIDNPKMQGYLEILEAKSQRLKQLTEDVIEASKISSGNITMKYMNLDLVELINQTTGEFDEKFTRRNLQIVLNVPNHPVVVRADGRRIWRVIENIYNNAAKYAMEGTRVYADLVETEGKAVFTLKNVSENPLNISADELTERFIRGDVSRSTEGSGLGLSIAKNLTKLQGGEFQLYVDGDLFKVVITFQKIEE